jgi:hypothetical protein
VHPTKAIQLLRSVTNLLQGLFKGVGLFAVCAQDGVDYPFEKASSCSVGVEDADRGYRDWERSVVFDLYRSAPALTTTIGTYQLGYPLL